MISKLGSDGVKRPRSTEDMNARLNGRAALACDSPSATLRSLISRPSVRANVEPSPAVVCLAIVDIRMR